VEGGDSGGMSGSGETPQALATRRLTARPAERVRLERKSTGADTKAFSLKSPPHRFLTLKIFILSYS